MSSHWNDIRRAASQFRDELNVPRRPVSHSSVVIAAALKHENLVATPIDATHPILAGAQAVLDPEVGRIWYDNALDTSAASLVLGHEIAHRRLHRERVSCTVAQATMSARDSASISGVAAVEGYGPEERREHEANLFAREFLLPAADVRIGYIEDGLRLADFVKHTGLPEPVLAQHLMFSLLVSDLIGGATIADKTAPANSPDEQLDESQRRAATQAGPLLVVAGPGTGKTRTLVARVVHLLEQGIDPTSILALTYSNKAAQEMRERIAATDPQAAVAMWIGTFHAFGLDVLRRYGTRIGIPEKPEVLNKVDGLLILERDLNELGLQLYLHLWEPTRSLRDILSVISRAKDELVTPEQYLELAKRMSRDAVDAKAKEEAAQAEEVAGVYAHYEKRLREIGALDFGDLICRTVEVLRHPDGVAKADLSAQYKHILVDEFQDVNRASVALLREIAGDGTGLWAVGDVRQSVYRFRGAAPSHVREFETLFSGAKVESLRVNYRAQPTIVSTYAALASRMAATDGQVFRPWEVHRPNTNAEVAMRVAEDGEAEGDGIAEEIIRLATRTPDPISYRDQAVLCRSHRTLERIARRLERAGVPVLYLGDIFERPEVRDLLSLLSLACEPDGRSLLRIARFESYNIHLPDVLTLIHTARSRNIPFPRALDLADDPSLTMSPESRRGLERLRKDVQGLCYGKSAWSMLSAYLIDRSEYLDGLLRDQTLSARQQRLAMFQFLQFTLEQLDDRRIAAPENTSHDPKRILLDFVRRLCISGDDRQLRQVPDWATELDAVRLMTMHASKGLEFRSVFIPYLATAYMPSSQRPSECKPPFGMIPPSETGTHTEEEECLLFVSLSRARDTLCLSRANRYGNVNRKPSKFLEYVQSALPPQQSVKPDWLSQSNNAEDFKGYYSAHSDVDNFTMKELDTYITCPRKYFYEHVLNLRDRAITSAYVAFHRVVYGVLKWMGEEVTNGNSISAALADQRVRELWPKIGPHEHPFAPLYEAAALALVRRARVRLNEGVGELSQPTWVIALDNGSVSCEPEYVELIPSSSGGRTRLRVRRIRTGRPTSSEPNKTIYALYLAGARSNYPTSAHEIETLYLTTDETRHANLSDETSKSRLLPYDQAMSDIRRGRFAAKPNDHDCPRCPNFFICPAAEGESSSLPVASSAQ